MHILFCVSYSISNSIHLLSCVQTSLIERAGLYDNALAQQAQYRSDAYGAFGNMGGNLVQYGALGG